MATIFIKDDVESVSDILRMMEADVGISLLSAITEVEELVIGFLNTSRQEGFVNFSTN